MKPSPHAAEPAGAPPVVGSVAVTAAPPWPTSTLTEVPAAPRLVVALLTSAPPKFPRLLLPPLTSSLLATDVPPDPDPPVVLALLPMPLPMPAEPLGKPVVVESPLFAEPPTPSRTHKCDAQVNPLLQVSLP